MPLDQPREDIFVSVCFADIARLEDGWDELTALSKKLSAEYRYYEILFVAVADSEANYEQFTRHIPSSRFLIVRPETPFYRCRTAVASEAIGDIVVVSSINELPALDLVKMIDLAAAQNSIVISRRTKSGAINPLLKALGYSAGFRVDSRDMLTACYPRTLLNKLLAHPDRQLALRFPPADHSVPVIWQIGQSDEGQSRSFREMGRRLAVVQKLLVSSAPRVLTLLSLLSLIVVCAALAFALYAIIIWLTRETVQSGWFTTSIVMSLTAAFLGSAIFGIIIGLQKILDALSADTGHDIIGEIGSVDLFDKAMKELNVEVAASHFEANNKPKNRNGSRVIK